MCTCSVAAELAVCGREQLVCMLFVTVSAWLHRWNCGSGSVRGCVYRPMGVHLWGGM